MKRILSLDLGGTNLRAATADIDHPSELIVLGRWPAPSSREGLVTIVQELCTRLPNGLSGIGITVPGLVEGTKCRWVPNLPYLNEVDFKELLAPLGSLLVVANDAQLALLAEATLGAARDLQDALLLAIGTGIGSAVLADGRIIRGAHSHACSFGWACADLNDPGDPGLGWLERSASGRSIELAAAELLPPRDSAALVYGARRGDTICAAVMDRVGRVLGTAAAGAISLLDPSIVLITGGVSDAADVLMPAIREVLSRHLPPRLRNIRVEPGVFGPKAGLVGAAIAAVKGSNWWRLDHT